LWPLALVAYVPLLTAIERRRPTARQAALWGWLTGTLLHLGVFGFLAYTMEHMSRMPPALAWAVLLIYALAMGLHQAIFAVLVQWTGRSGKLGVWRAVGRAGEVALLFAAVEFAVPFLFPWYLASAFYANPLWMQPADLLGVAGVSLLAMAVNALVAQAVLRPQLRISLGAAAVAVLVAWAGYGVWRMSQVDGASVHKTLKTLIVQGNTTVAEKLAEGVARLPMLDRVERLTRQADRVGVDLIVWPEGTMPFFWPPEDPDRPVKPSRAPPILRDVKRRQLKLVQELQIPMLFGTLRRTDPMWRQPPRNAALLAWPDGRLWTYDKRILLAFGEYLPGTQWFPSLAEAIPGVSHMVPGVTSGLVEVDGVRLLVNICYEALFGDFLRTEGKTADVLVNLTNDVWFGPPPAGELHLMVQQARPIELRRPLLRSTTTGVSACFDANGRILQRTPSFQEATLRCDAQVKDLDSPYRWWGDLPMWGLTLAAAVLALLGRRHQRIDTRTDLA
jgi:apolipoprotein N-acyltransferase